MNSYVFRYILEDLGRDMDLVFYDWAPGDVAAVELPGATMTRVVIDRIESNMAFITGEGLTPGAQVNLSELKEWNGE